MKVLLLLGACTLLNVQLVLGACSPGVSDYGVPVGCGWKLNVVEDVSLERPTTNYNYLQWLLVGKHPQFPNKRSLLRMEPPPSFRQCNNVIWAKLYVWFQYAHKASWHSNNFTPWRSRDVQIYQVRKRWNAALATSAYRDTSFPSNLWSEQYLEIIRGLDAGPDVLDTQTVFSGRPSGWMEWDVTLAVKNWRSGEPNYGLLMRAEQEYTEGRGLRFISDRHRDRSKHAYIRVLCGPCDNRRRDIRIRQEAFDADVLEEEEEPSFDDTLERADQRPADPPLQYVNPERERNPRPDPPNPDPIPGPNPNPAPNPPNPNPGPNPPNPNPGPNTNPVEEVMRAEAQDEREA